MLSLILIIGILALGVIALALVIGLGAPREEEVLQARLAEYAARDVPVTLEEIELSIPFTQRVIVPILRQIAEFISRFTPQSIIEDTRRRLELAGNPVRLDAAEFFVLRILAGLGLFGLAYVLLWRAPVVQRWALSLALGGIGFYYPMLWLNQQIARRKKEILKTLPDALDLLVICVEAGLGFDAAMQRVAERWNNELGKAFARVLREIALGRSRKDALRDMAARVDLPEMTTFVAAIIQAEQLGVSIAKVLHIQADQMRLRRRQRAEELARQAPIKMLFPLVFLIFPAIFVVLLGPALLIVIKQFGGGFLP
ncbi:MAG: type II secretion system F family protein [Thermoflexus sp.]|uniref:type II secretion system F family protein n=1 Tax=Thermoflexus sp. TaxID=1969742 RepID=UPI0025D08A19|nr:type II secretion system F family protein [Thermoflexus sp.]MCS6963164.1 type II secretion system F family protein [Thermoflexus sp.]MDW8183858.1 type II secretion system F family protein [Anaerolineae bacterium]